MSPPPPANESTSPARKTAAASAAKAGENGALTPDSSGFANLGPMPFRRDRLFGKGGMLPSFAAALAFYFLVSLVPFLIIVSKSANWLFAANVIPDLAAFLRELLPPESRLRPDAIAAAVSGRGVGLASTALAVWTAAAGMNELARMVHYVSSDSARPHPGGWRRRAKSLGLLGVWTLAVVSIAVLLALGPLVRAASGGTGVLFLRYPAAAAFAYAAFAFTYVYVPTKENRPRWRAASSGALLATALWTVDCVVFAVILPRAWKVSAFHGALGSALATLVWAYWGCWGVIFGACWTAAQDA
jgi:membrane protein